MTPVKGSQQHSQPQGCCCTSKRNQQNADWFPKAVLLQSKNRVYAIETQQGNTSIRPQQGDPVPQGKKVPSNMEFRKKPRVM